jgi:hypothetical protein
VHLIDELHTKTVHWIQLAVLIGFAVVSVWLGL